MISFKQLGVDDYHPNISTFTIPMSINMGIGILGVTLKPL